MSSEQIEPTATELEIEKLGLQSLRDAQGANKALGDALLKAMRLIKDPASGIYRQMTDDEFMGTLPGVEKQNYKNLQLQLERQQRALEGKLPISEGLMQQEKEEFRKFKEGQARLGNIILGDDPATATANTTTGVQALNSFNDTFKLARSAERFGELQTGQQNIGANFGLISDLQSRKSNEIKALPLKHLFTLPTFQNNAGLLSQQNFANSQNSSQFRSDAFNLAGQLGGAGAYGLIRKYFP